MIQSQSIELIKFSENIILDIKLIKMFIYHLNIELISHINFEFNKGKN